MMMMRLGRLVRQSGRNPFTRVFRASGDNDVYLGAGGREGRLPAKRSGKFSYKSLACLMLSHI